MLKSFWLYLAVAVSTACAYVALQPPAVVPASAPAGTFSAERAMVDVRAIAVAPHPTGSPEDVRVRGYIIDRLHQLGMAGEAHIGQGFSTSRFDPQRYGAASVQNIVGILPGKDHDKPALLVMSHHDTVRNSPGAADDTAGVAASLEIARMLRAGPQGARDVIFLFTDAEEAGLLGAQAFFASDPLAGRVGMVINLESRGDAGRASMFETGPGNGALVDLMARHMPSPAANSLSSAIYHRMPNDTDFTHVVRKGLPGLNFAFMDDLQAYHTPLATPGHLDPRSLQHMGTQAGAMVRTLADMPDLPASGAKGRADQVYGDFLGLFLIHYSPMVGWVLLGLSSLIAAYAVVRTLVRGGVSVVDLAKGLGTCLMSLLAAGVFLWLAGRFLGLPDPARNYAVLAHGEAWLGAVIGLTVAATVLTNWAAIRLWGVSRWGVWGAALFASAAMGLALQVMEPAMTPPVVWPLLVGAIAALLAAFDRYRDGGLMRVTLVILPGLAFVLAIGGFLFTGVGSGSPEVNVVTLVLALPLLAPLLHAAASQPVGRAGAAVLAVAAVGALVVTASGPTPQRPGLSEAFYLADPGQKLWARGSRLGETTWSDLVLKSDGGAIALKADSPLFPRPIQMAPAHALPVATPLVSAARMDGRLLLHAIPVRSGETLVLMFRPSVSLDHARLNGREVALVSKAGVWTTLNFEAPPPEGVTIAFATPDHAGLEFVAAEIKSGWPPGAAVAPRPANLMASSRSDATIAVARLNATW